MVIFKNFDRNHIKNLIYFWIHYIYVLKEFYCIHVMRKMLIYQGYWPKIVHGQLPVNEIRVKGTAFDREMIRLSVIGVWFFYWLLKAWHFNDLSIPTSFYLLSSGYWTRSLMSCTEESRNYRGIRHIVHFSQSINFIIITTQWTCL